MAYDYGPSVSTGTAAILGGGVWIGNKVTIDVTGEIDAVVVGMVSSPANLNLTPAIYTDNAGTPNTLLKAGAVWSDPVGGDNVLPLFEPLAVTAGDVIWIGAHTKYVDNVYFQKTAVATRSSYFTGTAPVATVTNPVSVTNGANPTALRIFGRDADTAYVLGAETSQALALTAINFPAADVGVTSATNLVTAKSIVDVYVTSAMGLVAAMGRTGHPKLNAWTFTLDGHDFYVLRLGDNSTLVYDLSTQQWSVWRSPDLQFWRPTVGANWVGGLANGYVYGSNIMALDDTAGIVWVLDPELPYDISPTVDEPRMFTRVATGQVAARGRQAIPCWDVFVMGDVGVNPVDGSTITLEYSDDGGASYVNAGELTVAEGAYTSELLWTSLGQITSPGRLFRFTDDGAVSRLDDITMNSISEN